MHNETPSPVTSMQLESPVDLIANPSFQRDIGVASQMPSAWWREAAKVISAMVDSPESLNDLSKKLVSSAPGNSRVNSEAALRAVIAILPHLASPSSRKKWLSAIKISPTHRKSLGRAAAGLSHLADKIRLYRQSETYKLALQTGLLPQVSAIQARLILAVDPHSESSFIRAAPVVELLMLIESPTTTKETVIVQLEPQALDRFIETLTKLKSRLNTVVATMDKTGRVDLL